MLNSDDLDEVLAEFADIDREYFDMSNRVLDIENEDDSDSEMGTAEVNINPELNQREVNEQQGEPAIVNEEDGPLMAEINHQCENEDNDEGVEPLNEELTLAQRIGCVCGCAGRMDVEVINAGRAIAHSLSKESLDMMVMGKVSVMIQCGQETVSKKRKHQKERRRVRCNYTHERELLSYVCYYIA
jgi:hypothetical protein